MPTLSNVAEIIMGQSPPSNTYNDIGDGLPFYQGKTDFGFKYPKPRLYCSSPQKIAETGDILISVRAPVGPTNIAPEKSCIGRGLSAIRAVSIDPDFLFFNLRHIEPYVASLGTGSTFTAINKHHLANLEVNSYNFKTSEQRFIAYILSTVQTAIEQQERLITLTRELKSSLMRKLFTEGLRGEKQKETEIGLVPESWEVLPLDKLLRKTQYGLSLRGESAGNCGILRMTNQKEGRISPDNMQFVDLDEGDLKKYRVEKGDLLFNRTNSFELVGRTAIFDIEGEYVFASYLIRLTTVDKILNPFFLNHYLNWDDSQYHLKSIATRAISQSNISATRLRTFKVPVPRIEEQVEILQSIDTVDKKIAVLGRKKRSLEELFAALLHQLMTGQIRVNDIDLPVLN